METETEKEKSMMKRSRHRQIETSINIHSTNTENHPCVVITQLKQREGNIVNDKDTRKRRTERDSKDKSLRQ